MLDLLLMIENIRGNIWRIGLFYLGLSYRNKQIGMKRVILFYSLAAEVVLISVVTIVYLMPGENRFSWLETLVVTHLFGIAIAAVVSLVMWLMKMAEK